MSTRVALLGLERAGWQHLSSTTGRTRQDPHRTGQGPRKSVWINPLHPAFREALTTP